MRRGPRTPSQEAQGGGGWFLRRSQCIPHLKGTHGAPSQHDAGAGPRGSGTWANVGKQTYIILDFSKTRGAGLENGPTGPPTTPALLAGWAPQGGLPGFTFETG